MKMKKDAVSIFIRWSQHCNQGISKGSFLPHEGFPHNNLAIPPCLVFWGVSIPWARSIQGTAYGAGVIISRSVMKLLRQKDEL